MTPDQRHQHITNYLLAMVTAKDWHAVSDAANDLRVLEAVQGHAKMLAGTLKDLDPRRDPTGADDCPATTDGSHRPGLMRHPTATGVYSPCLDCGKAVRV